MCIRDRFLSYQRQVIPEAFDFFGIIVFFRCITEYLPEFRYSVNAVEVGLADFLLQRIESFAVGCVYQGTVAVILELAYHQGLI